MGLALLGTAAYVTFGGGEHEGPGVVTPRPLPAAQVAARVERQRLAHGDGPSPAQILFGDLHVHTTFSADAFMRSLPLMGGEGAHPPADACDFARYCSGLDFFALTDHAEALSPQHWRETRESIRQCNAVAGDPADPDLVAFAGFEWSQVGRTAEEHYGHRNVVFRDLDDDHLPARPIGAPGMGSAFRRIQTRDALTMALVPILDFSRRQRYLNLLHYMRENDGVDACPAGVDTRQLPLDCRETATTPEELDRKLSEWGVATLVIPHGTTWGFYTPPGYEWGGQPAGTGESDERRRLVEVYSGHGNSEEYRAWRAVTWSEDGEAMCPEPTDDYEPCCWRAGEIIRSRCPDSSSAECEQHVREARANYLTAGVAGHLTVPGARVEDWGDCGQCRDCFLPAFTYRPGGSVQAILARGHFDDPGAPTSPRLGLIASSDNHSARPGTGYKEVARRRMTEASGPESRTWRDRIFGEPTEPSPESLALARDELDSLNAFLVLDLERQASFFMTGGLVAVHSAGRDRQSIWEALRQRRVYATSGPRILLWFDLVSGPNGRVPMGSDVALAEPPRFVVRAAGDFRQREGCSPWTVDTLGADRVEELCAGECYNPADERVPIDRIEVVRIRPQRSPDEPLESLIDDPWRVLDCPVDGEVCQVELDDPDFFDQGRDALYYVRAIQAPTPAVNAGALRCDDAGNCRPCYGDYRTDYDDDCLSETQERAWSSPIWVGFEPPAERVP